MSGTITIPEDRTSHLSVSGMSCQGCARNVRNAVLAVPGVSDASVNLEGQAITVHWNQEGSGDAASLLNAISAAGYEPAIIAETHGTSAEARIPPRSVWKRNLLLGATCTVSLMLGEWVLRPGPAPWFRWASLLLAGMVQVFGGALFYRGAWNQLKVGSSNMDTLVALGSTTAFAYSIWAMFFASGEHLYFMEAAAIITLVSAGHWIESRVMLRASNALENLLQMTPPQARLLATDGSEKPVPLAELKPGSRIVLHAGDSAPTDAVIELGESAVDESMLTGESNPAEKKPGMPIYAGTTNLTGRIVARVTALGRQTALARIIAAVERAQNSRARIQRLGDRVSSIFVPIVILIAILAGVWWALMPEAARHLIAILSPHWWVAHVPPGNSAAFIIPSAVLIVACPCAMGLATPVALMVASHNAARRGILLRDAVALEKAGTITTIVFDKTGTLTEGHPAVVDQAELIPSLELPATFPSATALAAALASHSNHPISRAIAALGPASQNLDFQDIAESSGAGILAKIRNSRGEPTEIKLGALNWLSAGDLPEEANRFVERWTQAGATITGLVWAGKLNALFASRDTLKKNAMEVVRGLSARNLKIHLLSGDNPRSVAAIAKESGIPEQNARGETRPEEKARFVAELQARGEKIAFVGDGINDAPALEQADLGIAVSKASDISREAADIVLLNSDLQAISTSLELARATLKIIKQNLFWAFFYNAVGIPLAALGFMSPVLCAAAMGLSDLAVIGNALRLRRVARI